jgi:hypothetical protein
MTTTRTRTWNLPTGFVWALLALAAGLLALGASACAPAEESKVPLNVLPEEGQAVVYEFYTDS